MALFSVSYSATAQIALLAPRDREALERLFASNEIDRPETTRPTDDGRFISRLGNKKILWHRVDRQPQILSIIDKSFAQA